MSSPATQPEESCDFNACNLARAGMSEVGQTRPRRLSAGAVVARPVLLSKRTHFGPVGSGSLGPTAAT